MHNSDTNSDNEKQYIHRQLPSAVTMMPGLFLHRRNSVVPAPTVVKVAQKSGNRILLKSLSVNQLYYPGHVFLLSLGAKFGATLPDLLCTAI